MKKSGSLRCNYYLPLDVDCREKSKGTISEVSRYIRRGPLNKGFDPNKALKETIENMSEIKNDIRIVKSVDSTIIIIF